MSNNKGCSPITGCLVYIVGGFIVTLFLIAGLDSCNDISPYTTKRAGEGLLKLFMTGLFFAVFYALFSKD